ncbi:MAG: hypothetical protein QOD92_1051 [Acidimicrobiaceae bacterium]|jgi:hypothetical protein
MTVAADPATSVASLIVPDIDPDADTLTAALAYAGACWYVGPTRLGTKNPGSVLGDHWHAQTSRDPKTIISWFAGRNLGLFLHVGRSDAWAADVDHPEHMPDVLAAVIGAAPYQSTRPDTPGRGHYVFRCPSGRRLGNGTGRLGKRWGEARGRNGVIVVAPTPHPAGGRYQWERTGPVPMLPESIAELLDDSAPAEDAATDDELDTFLRQHTGADRPQLLQAVLNRFASELEEGGSRHDAAVNVSCWAMREAAAGYYPALDAATAIRDRYIETRGLDRDGGRNAVDELTARAEYRSIAAWAVAQASAADRLAVRSKVDARTSLDWASNGHHVPELTPVASSSGAEIGAALERMTAPSLPEAFWAARRLFAHIRQAAHARTVSAEALLHAVLARRAAYMPHTFELPPIVGTAGSLNYYAAIVGPSGTGKSTAARLAGELVSPSPDLNVALDIPLGSGEGLAELYMGDELEDGPDGKQRKVHRQVRWNAYVYADEGEALNQFMGRKGNTTLEALRRGWSGADLGQANATTERHRIVRQYRLGFVVGFQPELAGQLLNDSDAGTPQRFVWASARDLTIPNDAPEWPGRFVFPEIKTRELEKHKITELGWVRHRFSIDDEIAKEVRDEIRSKNQGLIVIDPLNAHEPLHRMKIAGLLADADGRLAISRDDWDLASTIWTHSCRVRSGVAADVAADLERTETANVERHARRELVAEAARLSAPARVERIAQRLGTWIHREHDAGTEPDNGWPPSRLQQRLGPKEKHMLGPAIEHALSAGWITDTDSRYRAGEPVPT